MKLKFAGVVLVLAVVACAAWAAVPSKKTHRVLVEYVKVGGDEIDAIQVTFYEPVDPEAARRYLVGLAELTLATQKPATGFMCYAFDEKENSIVKGDDRPLYDPAVGKIQSYGEDRARRGK